MEEYKTFYKDNMRFLSGDVDNPINIKGIHYSLMVRYYGVAFASIGNRLARGFAIYVFVLFWTWAWASVIVLGLQSGQYIQIVCVSIVLIASILLMLKYSIDYIVGKNHIIKLMVDDLYNYGSFYDGRIINTVETYNGKQLFYTFSADDEDNIVGSYIVLNNTNGSSNRVVVWYSRQNRSVHTLL